LAERIAAEAAEREEAMNRILGRILCVGVAAGAQVLALAVGAATFEDNFNAYTNLQYVADLAANGTPQMTGGTNGWKSMWWKNRATAPYARATDMSGNRRLTLTSTGVGNLAAYNTNAVTAVGQTYRVRIVSRLSSDYRFRGMILNLAENLSSQTYYFIGVGHPAGANVSLAVLKANALANNAGHDLSTNNFSKWSAVLLPATDTGIAWAGTTGTYVDIGVLSVTVLADGNLDIAFTKDNADYRIVVADPSAALSGGYAGVMMDAWDDFRFDDFVNVTVPMDRMDPFLETFEGFSHDAYIATLASTSTAQITTGVGGWKSMWWKNGTIYSPAAQAIDMNGNKVMNLNAADLKNFAVYNTGAVMARNYTYSADIVSHLSGNHNYRGLFLNLSEELSYMQGYFIGVARANGGSGDNVALAVLKARNCDAAANTGLTPASFGNWTATLLAETDTGIPWTATTTAYVTIGNLAVTVTGDGAMDIAFTQGAQTYKTSIVDTKPLRGGYAGVMMDAWDNFRFDNFSSWTPCGTAIIIR